MSEMELPEELNLWPSNPYDLLGVRPNDNATDIRRAYTRLIRRFKPEHFPEHFRRLREAFDSINGHAEASFENWERFERTTQTQGASHAHVEKSDSRESSDQGPKVDILQELWRRAETERIDDVLNLLRASTFDAHQLGRAKLMEYWITKLQQATPTDSTAAGILLSNLHHFEATSELISIVRMELHAFPDLAELIALDKCSLDSAVSFDIFDAIRIRWEAAHRSQNFNVIRQDYEILADRFFDHREFRDRLAIQAVNHLIWSTVDCDEAKTQTLVAELETISGLRPFVSSSLERLEFAARIRGQLQNWSPKHANQKMFKRVVAWMWNDMDLDYPTEISDWLLAAANAPEESLEFFDFLCFAEKARVFFLEYFRRVIFHYAFDSDYYEVEGKLSIDSKNQLLLPSKFEVDLLDQFLAAHVSTPYDRFRICTLQFCTQQHFSIEKLVRHIKGSNSPYAVFRRSELLKKLEDDAALKLLTKLLLQRAVAADIDLFSNGA